MTYAQMKSIYKEDFLVYTQTRSVFHQRRAKLLEEAITDAIRHRHSDCTDQSLTSLFTGKILI